MRRSDPAPLFSEVYMSIEKKDTKQKPNLRYLRDKDREKVKGKFIYHEIPGGTLNFSIKLWKEDPVERYSLTDGEVYELPLGVARHINKNLWYPEYEYLPNLGGERMVGAKNPFNNKHMQMRVSKKIRRATFHSLDFVDIEDINPVGEAGISEVSIVKPG